MMAFVDKLNEIISSLNGSMSDALMYILLFAGLFFSVKFGFPQVTRICAGFKLVFGGMFKKTEKQEGSMSSFQALATAVAAQVGTGNVAGVATAITFGGPGAIFWMWVSAFFGMSTIFAEAILAQLYRVKIGGDFVGGPAYYISRGLNLEVVDPSENKPEGKKTSTIFAKALAAFFSVAIILALGLMGNVVQSNSIATAVAAAFPVPPIAVGIVIAVLAALIFWGGMQRIAKFAELVVPVMAVAYILASITILIIFGSHIIPALGMIFKSAFSGTAAMGGIVGATVKVAIQRGVARGLFSNEAGMGSTPHAHAVANVKHPVEQGLTAMVGVFIDTVLVCSATALAILVTGAYMNPELKGAAITQEAFTIAFGGFGTKFLAVCLTFFAFTTIVGWYYFGESNVKYLFKGKGMTIYRALVCIVIVIGSTLQVDLVWNLADVFNTVMVFPNIIALLLLTGVSSKLIKDYEKCKKAGKIEFDYPVK